MRFSWSVHVENGVHKIKKVMASHLQMKACHLQMRAKKPSHARIQASPHRTCVALQPFCVSLNINIYVNMILNTL